jgi:CDP-diacylglycerol--serine O-phosphatidyltransferase
MTFMDILTQPLRVFYRHSVLVFMMLLIIVSASLYPSDLENDYTVSKGGRDMPFVVAVEDYGRHINTLLPFAMALVLKDKEGLKQLGFIAVAGILASHGPKRLLNDVEIMGTRLGQRPNSVTSKHNTPSGHSTLAGACAYFIMRRYSWWLGVIVIPVLLATMYARVMLDKHTISATVAGGATGLLVAGLFSTKFSDFRKSLWRLFRGTMTTTNSSPREPFSKMLPNIVTIFGICVGLTAVRMALQGNISTALYLLVFAMILDAVDGRLARALQSESKIGAELDTLADFFNFGIATPLVIYFTIFANSAASSFGWIAVMIFSVCCALRLARFNVSQVGEVKSLNFVGVPAPALACLGLSPLFLVMAGVDVAEHYAVPAIIFVVICAALAVGTFPTISLKGTTFPASMRLLVMLMVAIFLVCLIVFPWYTLLTTNALYLLIIPIFAYSNRSKPAPDV